MSNLFFLNLDNKPYIVQYIYLLCFCLFSFSIFGLIMLGLTHLLSIDLIALESSQLELSAQELRFHRVTQIFSSIFVFIIPALLFSYCKTRHRYGYFKLEKGVTLTNVLLTLGIMVTALPAIGLLLEWNQALQLPEALYTLELQMKEAEETAKQLTLLFLEMNNVGDLLLNMIMIAILPALGEELLFRGTIQKLIHESTKKPHLAIWLSAALFSFIHFQFYGFVPRLLIGALLGYLFFWSGNLWYPIIGHFMNNGLQVILVYAGFMEADSVESGVPLAVVAVGTTIFVCLSYLFYQRNQNKNITSISKMI